MMNLSLELLNTWPVWEESLGCESKSWNKDIASCCAAIFALHSPLVLSCVELGANDSGFKGNILLDA